MLWSLPHLLKSLMVSVAVLFHSSPSSSSSSSLSCRESQASCLTDSWFRSARPGRTLHSQNQPAHLQNLQTRAFSFRSALVCLVFEFFSCYTLFHFKHSFCILLHIIGILIIDQVNSLKYEIFFNICDISFTGKESVIENSDKMFYVSRRI